MIRKIAVLGDSLLRGVILDENSGKYVRLAQNCVTSAAMKIGAVADNFSRFGMTSDKGLAIAQARISEETGYDAAVFCFGGNDVDHKWSEIAENPEAMNAPNVSCEDYANNMVAMVELMRARKIEPVLLTLPPISSERYFAHFSQNIEHPENIISWLKDVEEIHQSHRIYSDKIVSIANKLKCRIIDIRSAFMYNGNYSHLLCMDGIHPNAKGHELMRDVFVKYALEAQKN